MTQSKTIAALIVAAGRGERAGHHVDGPKQYRRLGDRAVIHHTVAHFLDHPMVSSIIVVIHPDDHALYQNAMRDLEQTKRVDVVEGGRTRQESVLHGLEALAATEPDLVLIHDGVRPFIDEALITRVTEPLLAGSSAVLPALPLTDTIKKSADGVRVDATLSRDGLFAAQTPQGFGFDAIVNAHRKAADEVDGNFTDDASIAEWAGMRVDLVLGSHDNFKLTVARDFEMAEQKISTQSAPALPDIRVGNGYDVHALMPGDSVILCGVRIAHDQALRGHSDADVGLHALSDALLATCGAGDIGDHFPPSDPQWKDADSAIFLSQAKAIVEEAGGTIRNADVTLICEAPKIAPHRLAMRQRLAELMELDITRCSVKATTNEQIGFVGRREGIAAIATVSVAFGDKRP